MIEEPKHIKIIDYQKAVKSLTKVINYYPKGSRVRQAYINTLKEIKTIQNANKRGI